MRVSTQSFWLPKAGNTEAEYEDAFWPSSPADAEALNGFRCAVADGATETSFSGTWARLLTQQWVEQSAGLGHFLNSLIAARENWASQTQTTSLAWYAEEKARAGAYSSLLGLVLHDETPGRTYPARWEAFAVGDTCLFQIRGNGLINSFPLRNAAEFDSRPYLLGSVGQSPAEVREHLSIVGGRCAAGDVFYLMTDALACWFLRLYEELYEEDNPAADLIADIREQSRFEGVIQQERAELDGERRPYLRNDDVTLLRLEIHE